LQGRGERFFVFTLISEAVFKDFAGQKFPLHCLRLLLVYPEKQTLPEFKTFCRFNRVGEKYNPFRKTARIEII
jgi:hypothetical protein